MRKLLTFLIALRDLPALQKSPGSGQKRPLVSPAASESPFPENFHTRPTESRSQSGV
jgi:hypothetical protein